MGGAQDESDQPANRGMPQAWLRHGISHHWPWRPAWPTAGNRRGIWATVLPVPEDWVVWAWLAHISSAVAYWHRAATTDPGRSLVAVASLDWQRAVEVSSPHAPSSNAVADRLFTSAE